MARSSTSKWPQKVAIRGHWDSGSTRFWYPKLWWYYGITIATMIHFFSTPNPQVGSWLIFSKQRGLLGSTLHNALQCMSSMSHKKNNYCNAYECMLMPRTISRTVDMMRSGDFQLVPLVPFVSFAHRCQKTVRWFQPSWTIWSLRIISEKQSLKSPRSSSLAFFWFSSIPFYTHICPQFTWLNHIKSY